MDTHVAEDDDSDLSHDQTDENDQNEDHESQEKNVQAEVLSKTSDGNNEVSDEDSDGEKDNGQEVWNNETNENDKIHISHVIKSIINSVSRPQDKDTQEKVNKMVNVEEETETDEEPVMKRLARTMSDEKKKKKEIP